jgi:SAM-dependent methyltransferase
VRTDFSRVARAYRWMEYFSFGTLLEKTRFLRIRDLLQAKRVLILGDGDGRFLARLLEARPEVDIDSVDFSPGMIRLAKLRVGAVAAKRVASHEADAVLWKPSQGCYDAIVTHFFLDCLSTDDIEKLVAQLKPHLSPGGLWINSDFAVPARGWMRLPSLFIVRALYAAFFLLAGLRIQKLPDDVSALASAGLTLEHRDTLAGGLLKSEVWRNRGGPSGTDR